MAKNDTDTWLSPGDVADEFGVSAKTVTRWANSGRLKSKRTLGGHRRFWSADIRALAKTR